MFLDMRIKNHRNHLILANADRIIFREIDDVHSEFGFREMVVPGNFGFIQKVKLNFEEKIVIFFLAYTSRSVSVLTVA